MEGTDPTMFEIFDSVLHDPGAAMTAVFGTTVVGLLLAGLLRGTQ